MERRGEPLYMGVDIASGSPQSRTGKPLYHVVIIDSEGRTRESYSGVTLARLIRVAWYYKPARIAFDNVMELAPNRRALERVLEMFPPESEIVQVTLTEKGLSSLRELAAPYRDIVGPGKLRPGRTAYILALLASKGYGVPVRVVEAKTKIVVSKARSPSGGGYSQQRYRRRVRASVLNAAMRVKEALDRAGLEYDMSYRRSEGGLESAVFTVYAPREALRGIVRPHRGVDYVVSVRPEYRVKLSLPSRDRGRGEPIILGVDPGITTGLAVLDLKGRVLLLLSEKGLDRSRIAEIAMGLGKPIIVAVDVSNPPETVRKLAAMLGAMLYSPPESLSVSEKRELSERVLGRQPSDSHQRDALAAAYKAFQLLRGKLGHIEAQLERLGIRVDVNRVKEAVIRGLTVAEALEEAIEERLEDIAGEKTLPRPSDERRARPLDTGLIASLEQEVEALRRTVRQLREENERLRYEAERMLSRARSQAYRDELVRRLEAELASVQEEADKLRQRVELLTRLVSELEGLLSMVWRGDAAIAVLLPSLTIKNLRRAGGPDTLGGELVALASPAYEEDALLALTEARPLAVIALGGGFEPLERRLRRRLIPLMEIGESDILYRAESFIVVSGSVLERARLEKERLEREYYTRRNLERLIDEYRKLRARRGGG